MRTKMLTPYDAFDALFDGFGRYSLAEEDETLLTPRVDIHEDETNFQVEVDLPGVNKDDLKVEIENGTLIIEAERRVEDSAQSRKAIRIERVARARYRRTFSLGDEIDGDAIKAELRNGVLQVTLPKREKALPKRIQIS
jgi:HSP20 family protein